MSQLRTLRSQIASLRRARALVRWSAAWSAVAVAVLWVLLAVFLLDFLFAMNLVQRLVVFALGLGGIAWAFHRYARPLLSQREDDIDVVLLVEKNQGIDSDLVAALQFESPRATEWGSRQLQGEVIQAVASLGSSLNVFGGFSREMMIRRGTILALTAAGVLLLVLAFPGHAEVFLNRLLLGGRHYPTATGIERVLVNSNLVLEREEHDCQPIGTRSAQGLPLRFQVIGSGRPPGRHEVWLASTESWQRRRLELLPVSLEERRERLARAAAEVQAALEGEGGDLSAPWVKEMTPLLAADLPAALVGLAEAPRERARLAEVAALLAARLEDWPGAVEDVHLFEADLPRMVDPLEFKVFLGDAWTEPAAIRMIPLPVIETEMAVEPPEYARGAEPPLSDPAARQVAVLEGSRVELSLRALNKPLREAWLVVREQAESQRWELEAADAERRRWRLPAEGTPLAQVSRPLRFELQVTDEDGLHLEAPIRGFLRLKSDRRPTASAGLVLRVAVPTAQPVIEYRVNDDYGIDGLALRVQIARGKQEIAEVGGEAEEELLVIRAPGDPLGPSALPHAGSYRLELSPFALEKGDQLRLTLEATDYRGDTPGETAQSEPFVLEISDESGVYAAILEADERSEQRLSEIIKRQLGIGDAP